MVTMGTAARPAVMGGRSGATRSLRGGRLRGEGARVVVGPAALWPRRTVGWPGVRTASAGAVRAALQSEEPERKKPEPERVPIPIPRDEDRGSWEDAGALRVGEVVNENYRVTRQLGAGSNGITYAAEVLKGPQAGLEVALKALSLRGSRDWKAIELFEREAKTLANLSHPSIPAYIDYFEVDTPTDRCFFIAQKLAPGRSLQDMLDGGWKPTEEETTRIVTEVLAILEYLESLRPPVVHRDIKPSNLILDGEGGMVSLVDFGAVAAANPLQNMGSTIIGTYGYMSPEQFRGEVTAVTDLYSIGASMLFLLTGRSPSEFPQTRLKVDVSSVTASPRLKGVLQRLLEPVPEDRYQSAKQAKAALSGTAANIGGFGREPLNQRVKVRKPVGTKVKVSREGDERLFVDIPAVGLTGDTIYTAGFSLAWTSFTAFWTVSALAGGGPLFAAFSTPFWFAGYQMVDSRVLPAFRATKLEITRSRFRIMTKLATFEEDVQGYTADLNKEVKPTSNMTVNDVPQYELRLREGVNSYNVGAGLSYVEQAWIAEVISAFLSEIEVELPPPSSA